MQSDIPFPLLLKSTVYLVIFLIYYVHFYFISVVLLIFFSCLHIATERPKETAMLLSLTGVRSIIANQWYTTLQENAERLEILFESKYLYSSSFARVLFQTFVCMHSWTVCIYLSPISPLSLLLTKFWLAFPQEVNCLQEPPWCWQVDLSNRTVTYLN